VISLCVFYPVAPILNEGGVDWKISFKIQVDSIDTMHFYCIHMLAKYIHDRDDP